MWTHLLVSAVAVAAVAVGENGTVVVQSVVHYVVAVAAAVAAVVAGATTVDARTQIVLYSLKIVERPQTKHSLSPPLPLSPLSTFVCV